MERSSITFKSGLAVRLEKEPRLLFPFQKAIQRQRLKSSKADPGQNGCNSIREKSEKQYARIDEIHGKCDIDFRIFFVQNQCNDIKAYSSGFGTDAEIISGADKESGQNHADDRMNQDCISQTVQDGKQDEITETAEYGSCEKFLSNCPE